LKTLVKDSGIASKQWFSFTV